MNIELLVRFPHTETIERDEEDTLSRLLDTESGEEKPKVRLTYSYQPMILPLESIKKWNKTNIDHHITIRCDDGDVYVVNVDYGTFTDFWMDKMGRSIDQLLPITFKSDDLYDKEDDEIDEEDGEDF